MTILGEIIKKTLELSNNIKTNPNPAEAQRQVLADLLNKAKNTSFGKAHNFKEILSDENKQAAFASSVPYYDYDKIYSRWWENVFHGEENITWPGKPGFFALSSGTTSNTKYIPVTDEMLTSIRNAGIRKVLSLAEFNLPPSFFEKEVLMLGSSTDLKEVNGHLEGEISGIGAYNIPFWFRRYCKPGPEISSINDWDERVRQIAIKAPEWDIGGLSGIPSWIELMLKRIIDYHNLNNIHEIWPNLEVYTSGGVAFEPYKKSFSQITGRPITVLDTYLASEGYIATQLRKETDAMTLLVDNGIYFEFVRLIPENITEDGNVSPGAKSVTIEEVEEEVDYVLIISTVSGAWRYMIGDTVKFTDKEKAEIKLTGRTKYFLNIVGSQLSEIQMVKALEKLESNYGTNIQEFTVSAVRCNEGYIHRWYLGCKDVLNIEEKEVASQLDKMLQEMNKNYKVARTKALKDVEVKIIPVKIFYDWAEVLNKKGGQTKVPRVMMENLFRQWEDFVNNNRYLSA